MLDKIYLEITNVCNLDCSFCHKTKRAKRSINESEFDIILNKIQGKAKYLYFHLMGEPLLHPLLPKFIDKARNFGFLPMLTTNGSLLSEKGDALIQSLPYKISISLHAPEANLAFSDENYFENCISFAKTAAKNGCIVALRLWNLGVNADNSKILSLLHEKFPEKWQDIRNGSSQKLCERVFLEWGEHFSWPDLALPERDINSDIFCYALRDHIGILADGTVVPCCLDADANLALGNIFSSELSDILTSARANAIYQGFTHRRAVENLCRKCGYARRFSRE